MSEQGSNSESTSGEAEFNQNASELVAIARPFFLSPISSDLLQNDDFDDECSLSGMVGDRCWVMQQWPKLLSGNKEAYGLQLINVDTVTTTSYWMLVLDEGKDKRPVIETTKSVVYFNGEEDEPKLDRKALLEHDVRVLREVIGQVNKDINAKKFPIADSNLQPLEEF